MGIDVNYIGPFLFTQQIVPFLKKSNSGRIINMASQVAQLTQLSNMNSPLKDDVCAAYQSSKIAVLGMTVLFAKELEHLGIKVNACCPGWVDTAMNSDVLPEYIDEHGHTITAKTPEQGADTPVWLATMDNCPTAGFFNERQAIDW
ncbi:MAG: SDR family NAD(P)-dependent oxidoreductase [Alcanivoracaceae bacterium]|nr:SDR family NAD(P)-dependent oxidoreductase [Alcanivoracaceae bacterium]